MEHALYADGNEKKISWVIQTGQSTEREDRQHVELYLDKVTPEQSKYISLHVGIFWGVGRLLFKNGDTVNVMLDSNSMFEHLNNHSDSSDKFISRRIGAIEGLIKKHQLKISYQRIGSNENLAQISN